MRAGDATLTSLFLEAASPDGQADVWHIPVLERPSGITDACLEPARFQAVLDRLEPDDPDFQLLRPLPAVGPAHLYRGEQSNSSVFFGGVLLKIFRHLTGGGNLDAELHEALAGTGMVAELHGIWRSGQRVLGIVLEALPDPLDGFRLALQHADQGRDFTDHAHQLGVSMGALHRALARKLPTSSGQTGELRSRVEADFLSRAEEVPPLLSAAPQVREQLDQLGNRLFPTQRIHGDAHLGQVLLTPDGWRWVDFEGEPLRPIAERRMPDSPLRDVAGMLRSFAYAASRAQAHAWEESCVAAFLDGYGHLDDLGTALLRAYEVDKASYEVVYESRNRPGWVGIPMRAFTNR